MLTSLFKRVSLGVALGVAAWSVHAAGITGAGASFPYPIYAKWASDYKAATGVTVNYQSIGSGGGQKQIIAKTVDFGASDDPMKGEDLAKHGLVQFPAVIGGIVPVVNLPGIQPGQLKFTGALLADIFLGKVKKWNDEAIAKLNPGTTLPATDIIVVHRSDGSGTTFGWTNYLSKVSPEWKSSVGEGKAVKWPVGQGGKGNEGVANYVKQLPGAIGYVEYAYAKQNNLAHGQVQNRAGKFVQPEEATFAAAAANADWKGTPGMGVILNDEPGDKSWPITSATFILMHKVQGKPAQGAEVLKFFDWAFKNGRSAASALDYVALPDAVTEQIRALWKAEIKDTEGKPLY
ncbi:phosphate ABC transporter substrate-binding protein PstS [Pigmentiphaga sp.]|uniref:phosphate ABC transporter substrate-binding protein PstS n=1 Tax=Pigmentiphaga sp. TaxID=1977564 RepID=UPI0025E35874|nr:phosphate ABC transporter substrate-binding protein PstS [Pigmentiphaga sp.]MBX6319486.1 phosphate ABC transporter substrate-binding protein PstS [Pigmentiphaga sp.]